MLIILKYILYFNRSYMYHIYFIYMNSMLNMYTNTSVAFLWSVMSNDDFVFQILSVNRLINYIAVS